MSTRDLKTRFTTYFAFSQDQPKRLIEDPDLTRNWERLQEKAREGWEKDDWVYYFYNTWHQVFFAINQTQSKDPDSLKHYLLLERHLWAYSQDHSYRAAIAASRFLRGYAYTIEDCFFYPYLKSARREEETHFRRFLRGFDQNRFSGKIFSTGFDRYLNTCFQRCMTDFLRGIGIDRRGTWALLSRVTECRLRFSLDYYDPRDQKPKPTTGSFDSYCLVCKCFQEHYQLSDRRRGNQDPTSEEWKAILTTYNKRKNQTTYNKGKKEDFPSFSLEDIQRILEYCAGSIRSYIKSKSDEVSLDAPITTSSDQNASTIGNVIGSDETDPLDQAKGEETDAIVDELLKEVDELLKIMDKRLEDSPNDQPKWMQKLDARGLYILKLRYIDKRTHAEIAKELGVNQSTVSRRLKRIEVILLTELWDRRPPDQSADPHNAKNKTVDLIDDMSRDLK